MRGAVRQLVSHQGAAEMEQEGGDGKVNIHLSQV